MRLALDITSHRHGLQDCTVVSSEQLFRGGKKKNKQCFAKTLQQMAVDRWEYKEMDEIS